MTMTGTSPTVTYDMQYGERDSGPCRGMNHSDHADFGYCDACTDPVAVVHGRKTVVNSHYTERGGRTYFCFTHHVCNPERVALHAAGVADELARGIIRKGQTVTVVKGRKVPKGTTGVIFWTGEDAYGTAKVGIRTETGDKHFTAASNVKAVTA